MVEGHGKVGVGDGSDKGGMFSRGREQVEVVAVDGAVNRQDRGDFYGGWR